MKVPKNRNESDDEVVVHHTRAKNHLRWEQLDELSDGKLSSEATRLAALFNGHKITPAELRVCVLLRHLKTSAEIAAALGIEERSIETYRSRIHKKLGLEPFTHLMAYLLALML